MTDTNKMHVAFCAVGLIFGLLIAVPAAWVVRPPKGEPKILKIDTTLSEQEMYARLGKYTQVTQPSTATNGYTVVQYESKDRGVDGRPVWAAQVLIK